MPTKEVIEKLGEFNWRLCHQDGLLKIKRDQNNEIQCCQIVRENEAHQKSEYLPPSINKWCNDPLSVMKATDFKKKELFCTVKETLRVGQMNDDNKLDGLGIKCQDNKMFRSFEEGQFANDELDGFGRTLVVYKNGKAAQHIGWWRDGKAHGYGMKNDLYGYTYQGQWD